MRKSFVKRQPKSGDMALQITSMADVFMMLLVFLLKNYSTSVANITPTGEIRLPVAGNTDTIKDALKLEVTRDAILLDQKAVITLNAFEFHPGEAPTQGTSGPLFRALSEQRKKLPEPNKESNLVVMAD